VTDETKPPTPPPPAGDAAPPAEKPAADAGKPAADASKPSTDATEPAAPAAPPKPAAAAAPPKPAAPAAPPKPKGPVASDASSDPLVQRLAAALPGAVLAAKELVGQVTVEVPAEKVPDVLRFLKETEAFTYLVDLTAVDWKARVPRFDVIYWLHSFEKGNARIRLRAGVAEGAECPTATGVFLTANWMEREVWDLFGIPFAGHPDLRRILTWDGFHGHPLRKDFPVEGIDTGAAIYPDRYPEGGGPSVKDPLKKVVS
jgi:NADH-quinone oxidoreductase subunit C